MFFRLLFSLCAIASVVAADNFLFFSPQMILNHLSSYNNAEKTAIDKDLSIVRDICFSNAIAVKGRSPIYYATAGGPGSRKSTILERFIKNHPELAQSVYVDPDPRALRLMVHTYYNQSLNYLTIGTTKDYDALLDAAYAKWRGGSNYITLTLLEEAFQQGMDIIHGTTSTGEHVEAFYQALKKAGYRIELILCSCEDLLREEALEYRNKEIRFHQSTTQDVLEKAKAFSKRMPIYFQYADKLYFYWSDALFEPEKLSAILSGSTFEVIDFEGYIQFVRQYEIDRKKHLEEGIELPSFKDLLIMRTGKSE